MGAALFHGLHYFMPSSHEIMQRSAATLFHRPHHFIAHRQYLAHLNNGSDI